MKIINMAGRCVLLAFVGSSTAWAQEAPLRASCAQSVSSEVLSAALDDVEYALQQADIDIFRAASSALSQALPCQSSEVLRPVAARIHRALGIVAFVEQNPELARSEFAAARVIEPRYRFPESMVPAGHPMLELYGTGSPDLAEPVAIGAPKQGRVQLDGRLDVYRPAELPVVVQLFDGDGKVWFTGNLLPEQSLPPYDAYEPGKLPSSYTGKGGMTVGQGLAVGAGTTGLAALSLTGAALVQRAKWSRPTTPRDELEQLQRSANGFSQMATGLGVVAVGLGFGASLTWEF